MSEHRYLALDFGAESGRAELVTLREGRLTYEEIHRFVNRPVRIAGTRHWDFPFLFAEAIESLKRCAERGIQLDGIGVDTWGVDFGLIDRNGQLVGLPVCYRDERTADAHDHTAVPLIDIFTETGCEPWAIGTLFQLHALRRAGSPLLDAADRFLNMPDLFNYALTGLAANEKTIVSTGCIMNTAGQWSQSLIRQFDLPDLFQGEIVEPGTVLGPLGEQVRETTGLGAVPVVSTCGHDTAAVVAAIPATVDDWAFLSCGTWSILGTTVDSPMTDPAVLDAALCNEYTLGGWFTCRNIIGLWLVQELKRKWDTGDDPWDYDRMTAEAETAGDIEALVDVTDTALLAPADMEAALREQLSKHHQAIPETRGGLVRCVLQSLALEYDAALRKLYSFKGGTPQMLYMVGGGTKNTLLCRFTADACGIPVRAGIDQCTALGNALTQAVGLGHVRDACEVRRIMANSFELADYKPTDPERWTGLRHRYAALTSG